MVLLLTKGSWTNPQVVAESENLCWSALDTYRGRSATSNHWHPLADGHLPLASTFIVSLDSVVGGFPALHRAFRDRRTLGVARDSKVDKCPFPFVDISCLKEELDRTATSFNFQLERKPGDREDVPIDFRFYADVTSNGR